MTTSKPTDIREFWIYDNNIDSSLEAFGSPLFLESDEAGRKPIHVISYSTYEKLKAENEDLKNTLNGIKNCKAGDFVVYHPVKNPDADNIFETINSLNAEITTLKNRLLQFEGMTFSENQEIIRLKEENEKLKSEQTTIRVPIVGIVK